MLNKRALKAGYYRALNGNVTINSNPVPIFGAFAIPETQTYPYIIVAEVTASEIPNDQCKKYNATVQLQIVTGYQAPDGETQSWQIAEQVDNIINPDSMADIDITINGWYVGETRLINDNDLQDKRDNYYIYRNIRTYSHIITKN